MTSLSNTRSCHAPYPPKTSTSSFLAEPVARSSTSSRNGTSATLDPTEYQFQLGAATIRLWDTVGLEEVEGRASGYMGAIERATELIRRLSVSGGVILFLFCVRGNKVTTTMQSNYRLFYERKQGLQRRVRPLALDRDDRE